MTDRDRSTARRVRAALLALAVVTACLAPAAPATAAELQVQVNGNPVTITVQPDVTPVPTTSKSASGSDVQSRGGMSARKVVTEAGVALASFTTLEVGGVTLSASEVQNGFTGDPEGRPRFATFDPSGSGVSFFRPMRDPH